MKRATSFFAACSLAVVVAGCSTAPLPPEFMRTEPWMIQGISGHSYVTAHYRICTTAGNPQKLVRFARLMEACHAQYETLLPPIRADSAPLEIDLVSTDQEWRTLTTAITGPSSLAYLRVGNGGYAFGDRFVCRIGDEAEWFPVAAHEGLHQYIARGFTARPAPSIEEGLATRFESVTVTDDTVTFDFAHNPRRQYALKRASTSPIPLNLLLQLNAGDIAGTGETSERYYGQCWALASLLLDDPAYRTGFENMLHAFSNIHATLPSGPHTPALYRPTDVKPLLEKYVAPDWPAFELAYKNCIVRYAQTP